MTSYLKLYILTTSAIGALVGLTTSLRNFYIEHQFYFGGSLEHQRSSEAWIGMTRLEYVKQARIDIVLNTIAAGCAGIVFPISLPLWYMYSRNKGHYTT